jgi:hypothetical protein
MLKILGMGLMSFFNELSISNIWVMVMVHPWGTPFHTNWDDHPISQFSPVLKIPID